MRYLSISVVCPRSSSCTFLPFSRARSRTTKGMRLKISPTGTSLTRMMLSRSIRSWRSMATAFSCTARHSTAGTWRSILVRLSERRARLITMSPTLCIRWSSRLKSTRTTCDSEVPVPDAAGAEASEPMGRAVPSTAAFTVVSAWTVTGTSMSCCTTSTLYGTRSVNSKLMVAFGPTRGVASTMVPISARRLRIASTPNPDASSSFVGTNVQIHRRSSDDRSGLSAAGLAATRISDATPATTSFIAGRAVWLRCAEMICSSRRVPSIRRSVPPAVSAFSPSRIARR